MFISFNTIRDLFSEYPSSVQGQEDSKCLVFFEKYDPSLSQKNSHILFLTDQPAILFDSQLDSHLFFLILSETEDAQSIAHRYNSSANILVLKTSDIKAVYAKLQNFFELSGAQGLFADTLLEILFYETGIQAMVDKVYPAFGNPIFVFDAAFNLIAANWEEASKNPIHEELLQNKTLREKEFSMLNKLGHIHEKVKKSEVPITFRHPEYGFDQMVCAIDTKKDLGHIVINAVNHPFLPGTEKIMILLKRGIDQQMKKDEFIRNNRGFAYEYFIKDLLDEKLAVQKDDYDYLKYVGKDFEGSLYCVVVETARSAGTVNTNYIRSDFEKAFPNTKTLLYNGEIVVLICLPHEEELSKTQLKTAGEICKKHKLYAGLSNQFNGLLKIKDYYTQALRAMELGIPLRKKAGLYRYSDYYMQHLSTLFTQKEPADVFCHPQLDKLIRHDNEHNTEYAHSLYMYLIHERNSVAAAEAMGIHPNTLKYRLKNIDVLADLNLDDYRERGYLILSYELMQRP